MASNDTGIDMTPLATPLAPSVEKAYYRKCIELKRRLNEVETANDEAKIRRVRLDRGVLKMRLERAFLLDELRKRMDYAGEGSDLSGDEGATTPPPDRPHRDKRRRADPPAQTNNNLPSLIPAAPKQSSSRNSLPAQRNPSQPDASHIAPSADSTTSAHTIEQERRGTSEFAARPSSAISGIMNGVGTDGTAERERDVPVNRDAGAAGEALSAGPTVREDANGERRILSPGGQG